MWSGFINVDADRENRSKYRHYTVFPPSFYCSQGDKGELFGMKIKGQ